jgi:hypothetical protein
MAGKYLFFFSRPQGYELVEREGEPPAAGTKVDLEENSARFEVVKVGPSPLPQDDRPCAYLQEA